MAPDSYRLTREAKLSVLQVFLRVAQYLLPKRDALAAGILWHNDLHAGNIFVDNALSPHIISTVLIHLPRKFLLGPCGLHILTFGCMTINFRQPVTSVSRLGSVLRAAFR
jgi:hypothetical protein